MVATWTNRIRRARSLQRLSLVNRMGIPLLVFCTFAILEQVFPRRRRTEPLSRRVRKNIIFAGFGAVTMFGLNRLLVLPAARFTVQRRLGLWQRRRLPHAIETALGVALLDYTLYLWHGLSHRILFLTHAAGGRW